MFDPWLISKKYDELDLTDVWEEKYKPLNPEEEKQIQNISLVIKQKGHELKGTGILTINNPKEKEYKTRRMTICGKVRNRYVTLTLELDQPRRFGVVTYLLEVSSEGDKMHGFTTYYDPISEKLIAAECTLVSQGK